MREQNTEEIDLRCPQIVADNAAKGLRLRKQFGAAAPRSASRAPPN